MQFNAAYVMNSLTMLKYCYSGIQRKKNVKPPTLPSLQVPSANENDKVMIYKQFLKQEKITSS